MTNWEDDDGYCTAAADLQDDRSRPVVVRLLAMTQGQSLLAVQSAEVDRNPLGHATGEDPQDLADRVVIPEAGGLRHMRPVVQDLADHAGARVAGAHLYEDAGGISPAWVILGDEPMLKSEP